MSSEESWQSCRARIGLSKRFASLTIASTGHILRRHSYPLFSHDNEAMRVTVGLRQDTGSMKKLGVDYGDPFIWTHDAGR